MVHPIQMVVRQKCYVENRQIISSDVNENTVQRQEPNQEIFTSEPGLGIYFIKEPGIERRTTRTKILLNIMLLIFYNPACSVNQMVMVSFL
jgi:hypothetical protein